MTALHTRMVGLPSWGSERDAPATACGGTPQPQSRSAARLTKKRIEVGEEGLDEVCAALIAGAAEFVGGAGTDERGHGFIECLAELDGLEVLGLAVEAGKGQGFREAGDGGEERHPIEPVRKGALPIRRSRKQEVPVRGADTGVFLAAVADGDHLGGLG